MMKLRWKLSAAFITLIIMPLLLIGLLIFFVAFNLIEKQYSQQAEFSVKSIIQNIQYVFKQMNQITDSGIANSVFETAINAKDPGVQDLTAADYLELNEKQRMFRSMLYGYPAISYAYLYNLQEGASPGAISLFNKDGFITYPLNELRNHSLYSKVMELNGLPVWVGPYEYPELSGFSSVFTQIRLVKEVSTLKRIGILTVQIKDWDISQIFRAFSNNKNLANTRFLIVNEEGLILYDHLEEASGQNIHSYIPGEIKFEPGYQSFKRHFGDNESVISMDKLQDFDWYLISVASWNSLSQDMMTFTKWIVGILFVSLLAAFLFFLLFMNRITKSIVRIVRFMRKVENGDLQVRIRPNGRDELHLLAQGFNRLVERVHVLLEQVKQEQNHQMKAQLRVLQAQIKPHFLFNALESINVLAVQNEGRKVSQMVYRLGNILRISIQDREEITIREEIEHLRSYLEIQKFRFQELFDFELAIPEEVMNCTILKLTLQPLVENCIQHGFEGIGRKGFIQVTAGLQGEKVIFYIKDNGKGISNEQLQRFRYLQEEESDGGAAVPDFHQERRGLGVRSVADRIRIQYGAGYGLMICSERNKETIIQCTLPKYESGGSA
ncbi:sensor histidine kinase [Paenibacillus sp. J2TS4]|uniref:cache domain-containing sensor histidine kinase n=1 Tax=Paenibacillus sp. J2TS4 TaxID=2807194 RepID=UPI001B147202|nr:sensor histidine kinase [Paenibacillus sp. J2TS4]GIP32153.1 hypothetical protein J2TS4_13630 [Paenibacillus sp. J2TS4]